MTKQTVNENEQYIFENGSLIINDRELKIYLHEKFNPILIPSKPSPGELIGENHYLNMTYDGEHLFSCAVEKQGYFDGQYKLYYSNGNKKAESFYLNGNLHGPSTFFSKEGHVLAKSWFFHGKQVGKHTEYYASGEIYSIQRFVDGKKHGLQEYFYVDGTSKTIMKYDTGQLIEKATLYHPDSSLKREVTL